MHRLILVTGGARSGKSDFAQELARQKGGKDVVFIATATAGDEEMARRIAAHRRARPSGWRTIKAPMRVGKTIRHAGPAKVVVVDCLTLLVSNVMLSFGEVDAGNAESAVDDEVGNLIEAAQDAGCTVIVVSNEVGLGIVPDNRFARMYRDLLGRANAALAHEADQVYLMVSGLAVEIKSLAQRGGVPCDGDN